MSHDNKVQVLAVNITIWVRYSQLERANHSIDNGCNRHCFNYKCLSLSQSTIARKRNVSHGFMVNPWFSIQELWTAFDDFRLTSLWTCNSSISCHINQASLTLISVIEEVVNVQVGYSPSSLVPPSLPAPAVPAGRVGYVSPTPPASSSSSSNEEALHRFRLPPELMNLRDLLGTVDKPPRYFCYGR